MRTFTRVVATLRTQGKDVRTVADEGLLGGDDLSLLQRAHSGKIAILAGEPFTGILFLRLGHIAPKFVLDALAALESATIEVTPPFIVVVERREDQVRVRVRSNS
jgi:hypothetical protein